MDGFSRIAQLPVRFLRSPEPAEPPPPPAPPAEPEAAVRRPVQVPAWILGLATTLATLGLLSAGLGTAALWRDEAATTVAVRRSWPGLGQLMQGSEAPLVPYYAVLKVLTEWSVQVMPASAGHVEALERWPSAVAVAIACGVLVGWLARAGSLPIALGAGGLLILSSGASRYGQEARPYALVMLLGVLATTVWWHSMRARRWRWLPLYAVLIAGMIALHALAGALVAAHLVAALLWRDPGAGVLRRLARVLAAAVAAAAGAGMASPLTRAAITHGTGSSRDDSLDDPAAAMVTVFIRLINGTAQPAPAVRDLMVAVLVVLPLLALTRWRHDRDANLVRLAVAWAIIPLSLLVPAALSRPNLLATRYLLFVLPGWALLAGIGLGVVIRGAQRLITAVSARGIAAMVLAGALAAVVTVQLPALESVRSGAGHGEDVRVLLAAADEPGRRELPIQVLPPIEAIQVFAYAPDRAGRLVNATLPATGPVIWPQRRPGDDVLRELDDAAGLIVLTRGSAEARAPRTWGSCRVSAGLRSDRRWAMVVLERSEAGNPVETAPALPLGSDPCDRGD